jgi:hypothetical protein
METEQEVRQSELWDVRHVDSWQPKVGCITGRDLYECFLLETAEKRRRYLADGNWPDANLMRPVSWYGVDPSLKKTYNRMAELLMQRCMPQSEVQK